MGESLLDWVMNTAEYRKKHHIPWVAKNSDGEILCESYDLNTLDKWLENPALNMRVVDVPKEQDGVYVVTLKNWENEI